MAGAHASRVAPLTWLEVDHTLNRYCYECHGGFSTDGDIDLINVDQRADLAAVPEKWVKVVEALRTHYMPHADGRAMPIERRAALTVTLESELDKLAADYEPKSASLRRLNRTEFSNTLNDLFFLDEDWTASLPADDAGYGFDNIAAALSFSPLLLERYFDVASRVALLAVPRAVEREVSSIAAASFQGGLPRGGSRAIVTSGAENGARQAIFFPGKGSYDLALSFSAQQAGDELAQASVWLNGEKVSTFEVSAKADGAPDVFKRRIHIDSPGEHIIGVRFENDFYLNDGGEKLDRNLLFHSLVMEGPFQNAKDLESPFLDRHFGTLPEKMSQLELRNGILRVASRAYRRPATADEMNSLWAVYQRNIGEEGREVRNGVCAVIDAIVTSPSFLLRYEGNDGDPFALASWLSYFIWSSMPDDRLFELASSGNLRAELLGEISRMLKDPKARALAENFAGQWWQFRDLVLLKPDTAVYESADPNLLRAMQEETRRLFAYVAHEDRSVLEFLNADYSFLNERLARHYGISGVTGTNFRKVSLTATPRRGIWSHGSVLTVTSYPNHTSPVLRGQWILENLIGLAPPPPPDNIPSLPGTEGDPAPEDLRASLAVHRENPDCASCHDIMDPFGLALEHFDGVGGLRSIEARKLLSDEVLFDGVTISKPLELAAYFEHQRSEDFVATMVRKMATYASGRGLSWKDASTIRSIVESARDSDYQFSSLVYGVIKQFAPDGEMVTVSVHFPDTPHEVSDQ